MTFPREAPPIAADQPPLVPAAAGPRREALRLLRRLLRADNGIFAALQTVATQGLVLLLTIATGVITGRLLGPEGRGVFAAATLWPQMLVTVCFVGVPAGIIYHIRGTPAASGSITAAAGILGMLLSFLGVAAGAVAMPLMMRGYPPEAVQLAWICILATVPYVLHLLMRQVLVALDLFSAFNLASVLAPLLYLLGLLVMWATTGVTVEGSALALIGSVAATALWMGWHARAAWRLSSDRLGHWLRQLGAYSARGAVADILLGVSGYLDRLVLIAVLSPEVLGLYVVANSMARIMLVLHTVVNSVVFPKMAGRPRQAVKSLHDHAFRFMLHAVLGIILLSFVFGREVVTLFYGEPFAAAGLIFSVLVVESGLTCIAQTMSQLFYACDRPGYVSMSQTLCFAAVALGLALLVPSFGAIGAAAAMALGAFVRVLTLLLGIAFSLGLGLPRPFLNRADIVRLRRHFEE
ncbi:oligosaccharide flippase family protein [Geminicoccaceae bacterium 1502E]|nr:oligosaccharide flippase family protein [Geminicoccaceae bacterium 1502E]